MRKWLLMCGLLLAACADAPVTEEAGIEIGMAGPAAEGDAGEGRIGALAPTLSPLVVGSPSAPVASGGGTGRVRAGVLTAGDIDDGLNLAAFQRYLAAARRDLSLPMVNFAAPVLAQVLGPDGAPASGARVTLRLPKAAEPFYDGYAGVDGMVTVFPAALGAGRPASVELRGFSGAGEVSQLLSTGGARARVALPAGGLVAPQFLDLVFVLDATGSMGDEIDWLARDLVQIVGRARSGFGAVDIRYGLIVYRDVGDDFVVRSYDFTGSLSVMRGQVRAQQAGGGGDYPEAAAAAMAAAMALPWRRGQGERLVFQIADAPPHDADAGPYLAAARAAAVANVQIFGLGASGVGPEAEYLMRQAAAVTGGRYLFLTDDSGVGASHAEPTISCYQVTALNDLLVRVLRSELSGRRIEAGSVLRTVGTVQNGVCRN